MSFKDLRKQAGFSESAFTLSELAEHYSEEDQNLAPRTIQKWSITRPTLLMAMIEQFTRKKKIRKCK